MRRSTHPVTAPGNGCKTAVPAVLPDGARLYVWRAITDPRGWADLVDDVPSPPPAEHPWWVHGQRTLSVGEPHDPGEGSTLLLVTVSAEGGAA